MILDEEITLNDDEDIFPLDEDSNDMPTEELDEGEKQDPIQDEEGEKEGVTDEQKLLDYLNAKEIKYNGEAVKLESLDKFIDTFQKGMNYDNLKAKTEKSDNAVINYITEKAKALGITNEQYIEKVKAYEAEQAKAKDEQAIASMVENGVPEEVAREVIETRALRESLKQEKAELEKQKEITKLEKERDKEYEEFLNAYPNIKAEDIPAEVFESTKNGMTLLNAYTQYENKILKEKVNQMEQNQKNASSSVVKSVTDTGTVEQQTKDAFLMGFDSV